MFKTTHFRLLSIWLVDLFTSLAYITVAGKVSASDAADTFLGTPSAERPEVKTIEN